MAPKPTGPRRRGPHPLSEDLKTYRYETQMKIPVKVMQELLNVWNWQNRPLSKWKSILRTIEEDRFRNRTGQPVSFDTNGDIVNGQNRFKAFVEAKKDAVFDVCFGIEPKERIAVDKAAGRTLTDDLVIEKIENSSPIGMAARYCIVYPLGGLAYGYRWIPVAFQPSRPEILEYVRTHNEELQKAFHQASEKTYRIKGLNIGVMTFLFKTLSEQDADKARLFIYQIAKDRVSPTSNQGLNENSVTYMLREKLASMEGKLMGERMSLKIGFVLKAWIAFRDGKRIAKLQIVPDKEEVPDIWAGWAAKPETKHVQ